MVGFLRKKKPTLNLADDTVLDRKGRVDGTSLLDDNGDPTDGTLFNQNKPLHQNNKQKKGARKNSDEENTAPVQYPPASYPYGHTYPPQQQPQQPQQIGANGYGSQSYNQSGLGAFTQRRGSLVKNAPPQAPYPSQYGNQHPAVEAQYGAQQYGVQQYPTQYGNAPPPAPTTSKKKFFRIPGYKKK